jgi:hypothetical protein
MGLRVGLLGLVVGTLGLLIVACSPYALECGTGKFCPPDYVCVTKVGCCADRAWLATVDGGAASIMPGPDGGVVIDEVDPDTGEPLPPKCGTAMK